MNRFFSHLGILGLSISLVACGGGSSSGGGGVSSGGSGSGGGSSTRSGQFVDGPVKGLSYSRPNNDEVFQTSAIGSFSYLDGETLTFFLGNITLGDVTPSTAFITPNDFGNAAIGIARFLQTLDADSNPSNGIQLSAAVRAAAENFSGSVDFTDLEGSDLADFARSANSGPARQLISAENAGAHLQATLDDIKDGQIDYDGGADSDDDGVNDAVDKCPTTAGNENFAGCPDSDALAADDDGDGIANGTDNCPATANEDQLDTDGDQRGDACDLDDDNDGLLDADEATKNTNPTQADTDLDGIGDGDDNCPLSANREQIDTDLDGEGDVCDQDDDNDGVKDEEDAFPLDPSEDTDTDGDGVGNNADDDDDGDGVPDEEDAFPLDPTETTDTDGDGIGNNADDDDDNDGVKDEDDAFPLDDSEHKDSDGDGVGDNGDQCATTPEGEVTNSTGCAASEIAFASCELNANLEGNKSIEVTLPTFDGKQVTFQILEPAVFDCDNRHSGAHPLMMHGPGYSLPRATDGFDDYRAAGYTVISWDPRGFGGSSGTVRAMDPEFEGQYLNQILDWAEKNLDFLAWRYEPTGEFIARPLDATSRANDANLVVGAQGSSYGGGFQLALLATDKKKRLDAIAPDITWHDLRNSLNPGDVVKSAWGLVLAGAGEAQGNAAGLQALQDDPSNFLPTQYSQDPFTKETLVRAVTTNEWPRRSLDWFHYRGLGYWCAANALPAMPYPAYSQDDDQIPMLDPNGSYNVPDKREDGRPGIGSFLVSATEPNRYFEGMKVLLSHGMIDTLFDFNEVWWNQQCLTAAGADVSIQTHHGQPLGHVLPVVQSPDKPSSGEGSCDYDTFAWFEHNLRGVQNDGSEAGVCFALGSADDSVTLPADQVLAPQSNPAFASVRNNFTERAVNPIAPIPNGPVGAAHGSGNLPIHAPLGTATSELILAGIPHISVSVSSVSTINENVCENGRNPQGTREGCDSITFVGLGLKRSGMPNYGLIDDQLTPLRGLGTHDVDLVGIAERINAGDELALLFYAEHPQFAASVSRDVSIPAVNVEGVVELPLYTTDDSGQPEPGTSASDALASSGGSDPSDPSDEFLVCAPETGYCVNEIPAIGQAVQDAVNQLYSGLLGAGLPVNDAPLLIESARASVQGCDVLDPAHCLFPFPSDQFTVAANPGSPQSASNGGTDRRVNFSPLAMPRNITGKPIDPTEWNRNDGFSPGQMILTYVPDLATVNDQDGNPLGPIEGAVPITRLADYSLDNAPVVVINTETGERHPVWAEIDLNAGIFIPAEPSIPSPPTMGSKRPALIIRPAQNFEEGTRYIVALRNLKDNNGDTIDAGPAFRVCRDGLNSQLPQIQERCEKLDEKVFDFLPQDIKREELYLAWDFTVASQRSLAGRLLHLRDDAFASLGETIDILPGEDGYQMGTAPTVTVDVTQDNPNSRIARRVEGTITVPSYVLPSDPSPLEGGDFNALFNQLRDNYPEALAEIRSQCRAFAPMSEMCLAFDPDAPEFGRAVSLPPNRFFYDPTDANATPSQFGDGLPDRAGDQATMTRKYICNIPNSALQSPARPSLYGHGLLGSRGEVNSGHVADMADAHNMMFCAVDWFGFSEGDLPNIVTILLDVSNLPLLADGSQQGMLNMMFLARAMKHPEGFAALPAFQNADGEPLFDTHEVYYDGNSQGGIMGGPVVAVSRDVNRGVLGVPGMNYSTLLRRSVDFDLYSIPLNAAYHDDLDRSLVFSLMEMIWERAENNGYAHHMATGSSSNTPYPNTPDNELLLQVGFSDHQVTMWSADVMARTLHAAVDRQDLRSPDRHPDEQEYALLEDLTVAGGAQYINRRYTGSALVIYDAPWDATPDGRCAGDITLPAPIGNVSPRNAGDDPHECPRREPSAKCQKSHFLYPVSTVLDVNGISGDGLCDALPALPDSDGDGIPDRDDAFPGDPTESRDLDGNGIGDNADPDDDGDGFNDDVDNCPTIPNDQTDTDGDGPGDACDPPDDSDNDGVADVNDQCPATPDDSDVNSAGCAAEQLVNASCDQGTKLDGGDSYQVVLNSDSGQPISFEVYEPAQINCTSPGAHPLVLHGHGFGGSRSVGKFKGQDQNGNGRIDTDEIDFPSQGFAVISIDQRGFGQSGGTVRVMDPDFEGKDLVQILDWAEANLDYLAWRDENTGTFINRPANPQSAAKGDNLVVGTIGSSYGGGYQMLLHAVDEKERIDAMVPDITWHDLRYSLNPGDVLKTAWDLLLVAGGEAGSYAPGLSAGESPLARGLDPYIKETLVRGASTNEFPRSALDWFRYHSPSYWCGLNNEPVRPYAANESPVNNNLQDFQENPGSNTRSGQPSVDVLLTQGLRDTLFNFNDAWWNYQCMKQRGGDVRLLTHQSGHNLQGFVPAPGPFTFQQGAGTGNCGAINRNTATLDWLNEKLKGINNGASLNGTDGALCLSLSDNDAVLIPDDQLLATRFGQTGIGNKAFVMDNLALSSVPNGALAQQLYNAGQTFSVLPLVTVDDANGAIVAGIPLASLTVTSPQVVNDEACGVGSVPTIRAGCDSISYVGLGVKRAGTDEWLLIDDQIMPVRGLGEHPAVEMVGIAERLNQGDELALLVYGYHPQFLASFSRDPSIQAVNLQGSIELPIYAVDEQGQPDFSQPASATVRRITESNSTCSNLSSGIDPQCLATGNAAHVVRTLCDYQWQSEFCQAFAFADPGYNNGESDGPLVQRVGAVHEHSGYSDGDPAMRPADYFNAGRIGHNTTDDGNGDSGVILDFMWSSEHSDNEKLPITTAAVCAETFAPPSADSIATFLSCANVEENDQYFKWQATLEQASAATERDANGDYIGFTALRGFEWTNDFYNHLNVYGSTNIINAKNDGSYASMDFMWDWLRTPANEGGGSDALVAFNHPGGLPKLSPFDGSCSFNGQGFEPCPHSELLNTGGGANWNDLTYVPDVDDNVVAMEVRGGDDIEFYVKALTKGWHIGPVDAEDEHQREWANTSDGKTLIFTRGRKPQDYYVALQNRRTVAVHSSVVFGNPGTPAQTPSLRYWANGQSMDSGQPLGSIIPTIPSPQVQHILNIQADNLPAGAQLALVSNTRGGQSDPIPLGAADNSGQFTTQLGVNHPASGQDWYFVVACPATENNCGGNRNHLLVSAPIWFGEQAPPTANPGFADALNLYGEGLQQVIAELSNGNLEGAIAALQGSTGAFVGNVTQIAAVQAGEAAGLNTGNPADPDAGPYNPPGQLLAGVGKKAIAVPVGTPLGGYARPPVFGDFFPIADEFDNFPGGDPSAPFEFFVSEFADFLPAQDHDGHPLPTVPDEARAAHSPYATYSPPSRGYYDSLITKAVALYDGSDCVVMVKTDFIGMLDEVVQTVAEVATAELGDSLPQGCDLNQGLVMSATHTHDGPGAIANHSARYFWLAMDYYQPALFNRIVKQLAEPVVEALSNLQAAKVGHATGTDTQGLNGFRRNQLDNGRNAERDALRKRIGVIRVDSADDEPLAVVINFAAHGIAFDVENLYFSGDVLAAVEREVEQQFDTPVVAMLVQSAGGDVSPRNVAKPKLQGIERYGKLMAPQVLSIYDSINDLALTPDIRAVSQRIILSRGALGYENDEYPYEWGAAQCNSDAGVPFVGPSSGEQIPYCLPAPPPDTIDLADNGVAENGAFVPQDTRVTAFKIGDAYFLAQPGEPLVEQGLRLQDDLMDLGVPAENVFIWGYSQDHIGYILPDSEESWKFGDTEGTTTFWGWKQGGRIQRASVELASALLFDQAPPKDEFVANFSLYSDFYDQVPDAQPTPSIPNPLATVQPNDIQRFGTTYFTWEGNDPLVELPTVTLEVETSPGNWAPVRRRNSEIIDTHYETHLDYRLSLGNHLWTVTFEAPVDWPAGTYRFAIDGKSIDSGASNFALTSQPFAVEPSDTLVISEPVTDSTGTSATLAYLARPDNYRLIDAQIDPKQNAPVRQGRVVFYGDSGIQCHVTTARVENGVATYTCPAELGDIGTVVRVDGLDLHGNTTPGASDPLASDPDRGSGIAGVLADFFANLSGVIQNFLSGDFEGAGSALNQSLAQFSGGLSDWFMGEDDSLAAVLVAASTGDPTDFQSEVGDALGLDTDPVSAVKQALSAARDAEPVVLTGAQLPGWSVPAAQGVAEPYPSGVGAEGELITEPTGLNKRDAHNGVLIYPAPGTEDFAPTGVPVNEVAAYRYDPTHLSANGFGYVEIPVQVDERMPYFLANAESDFSFYSGTDPELTYVWDREAWNAAGEGCNAEYAPATPDPIAGIDEDDEIVFMASDAGEINPSNSFPADWKAVQMIALADPLQATASNPADPQRVIYLVQKNGGSSFSTANGYVSYQRAANADQWIDRGFYQPDDPEKLGTSNTGYGPNRSGSVCDDGQNVSRQSSDRFPRDGVVVSSDTYRWEATGRWMVRDIRIKQPAVNDPDESYWQSRPDLIDRWKGRAFQQSPDSAVSLVGFEDEQVNWEANSTILGERAGPVRAIREVWGADSGTNVTKTETFYREAITYRYRVRVHPIPPDGLYTSWDYNRSAMVPAPGEDVKEGRYFTMLRPQGVPIDGINDEFGQIDSLFGTPAFFDAPDPTFNLALGFENWEQVSGKGDSGSLVYIFELKNAQALANPLIVPYYRDDACLDDGTGDDPVARPWPGENSTDSRVISGYEQANGGTPYEQLRCDQRQGAFGAHGIHYFFTHDSDNAFTPAPVTEIDGQQWQFMVPTGTPENVAEPYANKVRARLVPVVTPLTAPATADSKEPAACAPDNAGADQYNHLIGSLHEHSGYSDGEISTAPADYFAAGNTLGLDFMGSSEHSDNILIPVTANTDCLSERIFECFQLSPEGLQKWETTQSQADANSDQDFTAFRGFEWTSDRFGHINVFFSTHNLNAKTGSGYALSMEDFWQWLNAPSAMGGGDDGLAVFNHPGREDDVHSNSPLGDPAYAWNGIQYRRDADQRVVGIEVFGKSSDVYDDDNNAPPGGWYAHALDQGWHLGPVGAEDEHGTSWAQDTRAKTVLLADGRSRADLKNAMQARRFYALAHHFNHVRLNFSANNQPMGSILALPVGSELQFSVGVENLAGSSIEIVGPGGEISQRIDGISGSFAVTVNDSTERWRYARVRNANGNIIAYSAPIWFRASESAYPTCPPDLQPPPEPGDAVSGGDLASCLNEADPALCAGTTVGLSELQL
jgi:cephalosporin-C deacetylase-like acetyl esterase